MSLESDITRAIKEALSEGGKDDLFWSKKVTRAQLARILGKLLTRYGK